MQAPTLTLSDLVFGPVCRDLDPVDRADMIAEAIASHAKLEAELEDLRGQISEQQDEEERIEELGRVLKNLIDAIDGAKIGKVARVGSLVVIEPHANTLEVSLGDALKAAREAL